MNNNFAGVTEFKIKINGWLSNTVEVTTKKIIVFVVIVSILIISLIRFNPYIGTINLERIYQTRITATDNNADVTSATAVAGDLNSATVVEQHFQGPSIEFNKIEIYTATYLREFPKDKYTLKAVILDSDNIIVAVALLDFGLIFDNEYIVLSFNERIMLDQNTDYVLRITSDAPLEQSISFWVSEEDKSGGLFYNNSPLTGTLIYRFKNDLYL